MTVHRIIDYLAAPALLRRPTRDVRDDEFTSEPFHIFCRDLVETMRAYMGKGLSATQIAMTAPDGTTWRVFAIAEDAGDVVRTRIVANPTIVVSDTPTWVREACLSFRSVGAMLRAPSHVELEGRDGFGGELKVGATGFDAQAIAHEVDHLRGKLLIDRMSKKEREKFLTKVARVRMP